MALTFVVWLFLTAVISLAVIHVRKASSTQLWSFAKVAGFAAGCAALSIIIMGFIAVIF
jgi:hypothetical protein